MALCTHCKQDISRAIYDGIVLEPSVLGISDTITYSCRSILSVSVDPISLKTDTVAAAAVIHASKFTPDWELKRAWTAPAG